MFDVIFDFYLFCLASPINIKPTGQGPSPGAAFIRMVCRGHFIHRPQEHTGNLYSDSIGILLMVIRDFSYFIFFVRRLKSGIKSCCWKSVWKREDELILCKENMQ